MPETRYLAHWCSHVAVDAQDGSVEPDLCQYDTAEFSTFAEAARYGCECNCYGSECFVNVQQRGLDRYTKQPGWVTRGRWLCVDGEAVEQVDQS